VRKRLASRSQILGRELFLERRREPSRAVLILGSGRSGTTWLAESIARRHRSRLLFEPFHPLLGAFGDSLRLFLSPPERDPSFERAVDRVLSGRVRSVHMDQILTTRLPRGRIVKDVHAANLLPWLRTRHPSLPIVFAVRNPIAASLSRLRSDTFYGLGDYLATPKGRREAEGSPVAAWLPMYDERRSHGEALVRLVAEWCIENVHPLSHIDGKGVVLAFYENVVLEPVSELTRLGIFCAGPLGPPRDEPADGEVRTPSAMDWHGTAADARRSGDWRGLLDRWTSEVPRSVVSDCLGVLSDFGLDRLYGDGPMPLSKTPVP
jgi:sulfotransferase family protein